MYLATYVVYKHTLVEPNFDLMESSSQVSSTEGNSPQPSPRLTRWDVPVPGFSNEPLVRVGFTLFYLYM